MEPTPDEQLAVVPSRLFTQRKRVVLLNAIKQGQTITAACARAGIGRVTFYDHYNGDPAFVAQVERAKGQAEAALVESITNGAHSGETIKTPGGQVTVRPGDWRAAAWLLEHHPNTRERYAPISKTQISGDPDNATPVQVEVEGDGMNPMDRLGAVVTVLQRAGVLLTPHPGEVILLDGPPEPTGATGTGESPEDGS
jgi:hypothetical protein